MGSSWLEVLVGLVIHPCPESLLAYACCFLFLLLLLLLLYFKLKKKSNIPTNWPLVGMFPAVLVNLDNPHEWITDVLRDCKSSTLGFRGPWLLGMDFVGTCDPATVNHVFNVNFANYPKGGEFSEIFDILGNGIFNADDESWRSQRKKAHRLFAHPRFRSFVSEYSREKVENGLVPLLTQLAEQQVAVDLQDVFLRLTFDMTCGLVFGVDPGCLSPEFPSIPFARAMDDAMEALFLRHFVPSPYWKLMKWLGIGKERKLAAAREVMDGFVAESIAKSREAGTMIYERSLLTSYINGDEHHDDEYVRDTTVNFMLAGRDTVAAALTWFFWLLSKNPTAETEILHELGGGTELQPSSEELGRSVYLHAALCEALRLYPPVPFERKGPVRSDVLPSGRKVPSGGKVMFSAYSMGRMEGIWGEDCLEFKPERWITEQGGLRHEPAYKFLSFNCGPRTCVGKDMAFSQMKAVVAAMVANFDVEPVEGYVVQPKLSVILHMRNGWKVRIKKKKKKNHRLLCQTS